MRAKERPAPPWRALAARALALALATPILAIASASAQTAFPAAAPALYEIDRLNDYAAQVSWRFVRNEGSSTWVCRGQGSAIFLGGSRFLTAAHVVDQNPFTDDCAEFGRADPVVEFGAAQLRGRVVKAARWEDRDGLAYRDGMDLALIDVDGRMIPVALRSTAPLAICDADTPPAMEVRIATEYGVDVAMTEAPTRDAFARIDFVARGGASGGGIFDPKRRCLLGIISNGGSQGTNYVPSDAIRRFLADRDDALVARDCASEGQNEGGRESLCDAR